MYSTLTVFDIWREMGSIGILKIIAARTLLDQVPGVLIRP